MAPVVMAITAVASAAMSYKSYQQQEKAASTAEELGRMNAAAVEAETQEEATRLKTNQRRALADARATGAATGFAGGTQDIYLSDIAETQGRELAWLKKAGASVGTTRPGDKSVFKTERIDMAREPLAELYIVIKSDSIADKSYVANYPNSRYGGIFSKYLGEDASPDFNVQVIETVTYVMQQTPCTAVTVSLIPLNSEEPLEPVRINRVSQILYSSIINFFKEFK